MNIRYSFMLVAGLFFVGNVLAADGESLAKNGGCTNCHDVEKMKVGPPFREVAAKYKGDKSAQATLEQKVRSGGYGNWGIMPMPPTDKSVSDDDIKNIVQWVLSLK